MDSVRLSRWKIVGASIAGSRHTAAAKPCEDSWGAEDIDEITTIIAVCDGAGSARLGGQGAALAVKAGLTFLSQQLRDGPSRSWRAILQMAVEDVQSVLATYVRECREGNVEAGVTLDDLATTILLCVLNAHNIAILQIGDGGIVGQFMDGSFRVLTSAETRGEYVNETLFITSPEARSRCAISELSSEDLKGIALFSDGIELLSVRQPQNIALAGFFRPVFKFANNPEAANEGIVRFLSSPQVCERTNDDKTLVLVTRKVDAAI